jgi:hypothetical protein
VTTTADEAYLSNGDFEFLIDDPEDNESDEEVVTPEVTSENNAEFVHGAPESLTARKYRKKTAKALGHIWRPLLGQPQTLPDAATIIKYGPDIAKAVGDLADQDPRARKAIDFVTEGVDNPYINLLAFTVPMIAQLMRNHEHQIQPEFHGIRIPFTKREIKVKFGIKLGRLRNITFDPSYIQDSVFGDPRIQEALAKQGLTVAYPTTNAPTGNGRTSRKRS